MPVATPNRRAVLVGATAAALSPWSALHAAAPLADKKPRSFAATHGAAPFLTEHLIPGSALDLTRVNPSAKAARVIALTIDDGPDPNDPVILDILKEHEARATFFFIGRKIAEHAKAAAQVAASGNEIGSHSQTHPMMSDLTAAEQERDLSNATHALGAVGVHPTWFRPPFGDFDATTLSLARAQGLQTVLWTIDSQDWKGTDAATIANRVTARLAPGAVILMHSTKAASVKALPTILDAGRRRGFRFVTLTDWRQAMAVAPR
jgi:peptidoglycan-N-acetylglucosamine deacetylase